MATKNCPRCDKANPVACKKCACGHVFFTNRRSANAVHVDYSEDISEPSTPQEPEVPRRRTARVTRQQPQFYDALQVENQTRAQRELQKRRKASKSDDIDASSEEIPEKPVPTTSAKRRAESPPAKATEPAPKKRRGRPPGLTNRRSGRAQILPTNKNIDASAKAAELAANNAAEEQLDNGNIHDVPAVKALQMNMVLSDINSRISSSSVRAEVNVPVALPAEESAKDDEKESVAVESEAKKPNKKSAAAEKKSKSSPVKKDVAKAPEKTSPVKSDDLSKATEEEKSSIQSEDSKNARDDEKASEKMEVDDVEPKNSGTTPVKMEVDDCKATTAEDGLADKTEVVVKTAKVDVSSPVKEEITLKKEEALDIKEKEEDKKAVVDSPDKKTVKTEKVSEKTSQVEESDDGKKKDVESPVKKESISGDVALIEKEKSDEVDKKVQNGAEPNGEEVADKKEVPVSPTKNDDAKKEVADLKDDVVESSDPPSTKLTESGKDAPSDQKSDGVDAPVSSPKVNSENIAPATKDDAEKKVVDESEKTKTEIPSDKQVTEVEATDKVAS